MKKKKKVFFEIKNVDNFDVLCCWYKHTSPFSKGLMKHYCAMNNKFWHPPAWLLLHCTLNTSSSCWPPPTRSRLCSPCSWMRRHMSDKINPRTRMHKKTNKQKLVLTHSAPAASHSVCPSRGSSQDYWTSPAPSDLGCDLQHCQPDGPERKTLCRERIIKQAGSAVMINKGYLMWCIKLQNVLF